MDIVTKHALHIPRTLEPGVLHVSREYEVARHLCPCGCGEGVVTPLGAGQWTLTEDGDKPTLSPSISNAQTCKAHYFITAGKVVMA
jgi:hypothetical protein